MASPNPSPNPNQAHLREALAVEGFALSEEEMARLSALALEPLV